MTKRRDGLLLELGLTDYDEALELQYRCESARKAGLLPDLLILLEHDRIYTLGRSFKEEHLLFDKLDLETRGIKIREIRRGGDITYHGPGQLVGYPILDLNDHGKDVHLYLRKLERCLISSLKNFDLEPYTVEGKTGVWCEGGKVAAIGVGISRWVTTHGFALNVNTDLSYFGGIIACGIHGRQATSMQALLQQNIDMNEVRRAVSTSFAREFGLEMSTLTKSKLDGMLPN